MKRAQHQQRSVRSASASTDGIADLPRVRMAFRREPHIRANDDEVEEEEEKEKCIFLCGSIKGVTECPIRGNGFKIGWSRNARDSCCERRATRVVNARSSTSMRTKSPVQI